MAGYKVPRREAVLNFNDTDWAGMEVKINLSAPLSVFFAIEDTAQSGKIRDMLEVFAEHVLVEWNLEDDDGLIPADKKGIGRVLPNQARAIVEAYLSEVAEVRGPLGQASSNGSTLESRQIEREIPSTALTSGDALGS